MASEMFIGCSGVVGSQLQPMFMKSFDGKVV